MAFLIPGGPVGTHQAGGGCKPLDRRVTGHSFANPVRARPGVLHVLGRSSIENQDICGEYELCGTHHGRAAYTKSNGAAIRFWPPARRWVIDRQGLRDSDVCVAYADDDGCMDHPAGGQPLIWNVWDSTRQAHVVDTALMVLDAPKNLTLVGQANSLGKSSFHGSYELVGVHHSRPLYSSDTHCIRYDNFEQRWFICEAVDLASNIVVAFAEAPHSNTPADLSLLWHCWNGLQEKHLLDPTMKVIDAPVVLHILGRRGDSENRRINGTYQLAGVHDNRPVYVQPDTHHMVLYCAKQDRWMIDCNDQNSEGLMSSFSNWLTKGDWSTKRCTAFSEARGVTDPGHTELEWYVFDSRSGRHVKDLDVRATTAPISVTLHGREPQREAAEINGDYLICGTHQGFPAYQKMGGSELFLSWCAPVGRWMLSRDLRRIESCVAYADNSELVDHPACKGMIWHVFEACRGCHLVDDKVAVVISPNGPAQVPSEVAAQPQTFGGA